MALVAIVARSIKNRWFQPRSPTLRKSSPAQEMQGFAMTTPGQFEGGVLEQRVRIVSAWKVLVNVLP